MFEYKVSGHTLHLARGNYRNNGAAYVALFDEYGNYACDVSVNTPYSAKNTIVLDHNFLSMKKDLVEGVIEYLTDGKICDIETTFVLLPKYWLDMANYEKLEVMR